LFVDGVNLVKILGFGLGWSHFVDCFFCSYVIVLTAVIIKYPLIVIVIILIPYHCRPHLSILMRCNLVSKVEQHFQH
jgi:hypothetical protein